MVKQKILLFDFGCILVGLDKQRCTSALKKIGCGRIAYYVDECKQEDLFHDLEIGGKTEVFCDEARRKSSYTDADGKEHPCMATDEEICWAWNQLLTGVPEEKLRFIRHLHDDLGYRTAILSNTNWIHWEHSVKEFFTVEGREVTDYFDDIFLSCDLGLVKPDDRIYDIMLEHLGVKGEDVFFIDDSARNCEAASRHGIECLNDIDGTQWMARLQDMVAQQTADDAASAEERQGRAAVIGNFDGVHKGHQYVLEKLLHLAGKYELRPLVLTFDKHPRSYFHRSKRTEFLTTLDERRARLSDMGIADMQVLEFNDQLAAVSAYDFMKDVLRDKMNVKLLLLGYDNRFGKRNDAEDFHSYQEYGKELGIKLILANPLDVEGERVSSSHIRHLIERGAVDEAARCLGYNYFVTGEVKKGHQEGRKIGFPTANILPPPAKLIPATGVYVTEVLVAGNIYKGITNVGCRPTFGNGTDVTIETYIDAFEGDLYGKEITVSFVRRIRDEICFDNAEQLKVQIEEDMSQLAS